jgi:hypothetical protein
MTKETVTIKHTVYRDNDGNPTCAMNFENGEVCEFYRTYKFGFCETCVFAPDVWNGLPITLDRRDDGLGTLIPGSFCPLWNK